MNHTRPLCLAMILPLALAACTHNPGWEDADLDLGMLSSTEVETLLANQIAATQTITLGLQNAPSGDPIWARGLTTPMDCESGSMRLNEVDQQGSRYTLEFDQCRMDFRTYQGVLAVERQYHSQAPTQFRLTGRLHIEDSWDDYTLTITRFTTELDDQGKLHSDYDVTLESDQHNGMLVAQSREALVVNPGAGTGVAEQGSGRILGDNASQLQWQIINGQVEYDIQGSHGSGTLSWL